MTQVYSKTLSRTAEAISLPAQVRGLLLLEVVSGGQRGTQKVLIE